MIKPKKPVYVFIDTLIRFKIASDSTFRWGFRNIGAMEHRIEEFRFRFQRNIDEPIPYWIENA